LVAEAVLEYEVLGSNSYDYVHTYTPPQYRGKGLSDVVSTAAMDWIAANKHKVRLTCGFLATTFIERHPEYRSILEEEASSGPYCKI